MKKQDLLSKNVSVKKPLKTVRVAKQVNWDWVRRRAYEIFEERNRQNIPGDHLSDWIKAEEELKPSARIK